MHGHNYVVFLHARMRLKQTAEVDDIGRVIDFSVLKERIGGWIDEYWDHGFVYYHADTGMYDAVRAFSAQRADDGPVQKAYAMSTNPTAENMADFLLRHVCPDNLEDTDVEVYKVVLWETENCFAEAEL
jgi:6-pyruvoyltetrahydropterin/6-carboxytetrahydropterin synthase